MSSDPFNWNGLPPELKLHVAHFCTPEESLEARSTNKDLLNIFSSRILDESAPALKEQLSLFSQSERTVEALDPIRIKIVALARLVDVSARFSDSDALKAELNELKEHVNYLEPTFRAIEGYQKLSPISCVSLQKVAEIKNKIDALKEEVDHLAGAHNSDKAQQFGDYRSFRSKLFKNLLEQCADRVQVIAVVNYEFLAA